MAIRVRVRVMFGLAFAIAAFSAQALPQPQRVSPHAWAWIGPYEAPSKENQGFRMNLGFVVGTEAVAVIDSGYTPDMARAMVREIRAVTTLPIRYVINTNSQPHRIMGNEVFRQKGARIVAATEAAERMQNEGNAFGDSIAKLLELPAALAGPGGPELTIEANGHKTLELGGHVTLSVTPVGRAHTRGSLIVQVDPDQTVFAGDVLYGGRLLAVLPDSHVGEWIAAFERLRDLDAAVFVPGHGRPGPLADFEHPTYAYLSALKTHMDQAVEDGTDIGDAMASFDDQAWRKLANFSELAGRNASLTYLESEAEGF